MHHMSRALRWVSALITISAIAACGGGGGGTSTPPGQSFALGLQISGNGAVQSEPAGLNCSANCSADFAAGTPVTLTASAAAGYAFNGWAGACSGSASNCVVTLDQAQTVSASFSPSQGQTSYTMSVNVSGAGTVTSQPAGINCTGACSADFTASSSVTLTATPGAGQAFSGWSGDCSGASTTCTVTMGANRSAQAAFTAQQAAGWTDQLMVSAPASDKHGFPRAAMASDGSTLSTWFQQVDNGSGTITGYIVWSSRYTPGAGWSTPSEVTRVGPSAVNQPYRLAMNSLGKGVLVWTELKAGETTKFDVVAKPFDLNTGWGANSVISSPTLIDQTGNLDAGVDPSGNAVVTWLQINPGGPSLRAVWANRFAVSGGWGSARMLNDTVDDGAINPSVAVLSNGDALAVWRSFGGAATSGITVRKYTAGGTWAAATVLVPISGSGSTRWDVGVNPAIAADKSGGALLVWWQADLLSGPSRFETAMWSQRYVSDAWSSSPVAISAIATGTPASSSGQVKAAISFNAQNRAAVVWIPSSVSTRVWVNRSRADGSWETEQTANVVTTQNVSEAAIGIDDQSNMTASWFSIGTANNMTNRFTEGTGWGTQEARAVYDNTRGVVSSAQFAHNGRGDVALVYQLNPNILAQGSQIFSRYFRAAP